uniref:UV damage repair endonuclease n=1 Tax=viral metagenome TaxID=1070528 RepID=A0A6C0JHN9_9ZZZZ
MSVNKKIQLGLCCLNTELREQKPPIFASRSCIMRTFNEKGIRYVQNLCLQNLDDILKMIEWNELNGIKVFRLSSDMFPHFSNPKVDRYTLDFADQKLKEIGKLAKKYNMRLTFHPGQYDVMGTPNEDVLKNTLLDLSCHADILDRMECDQDSVMVVHGGGVYGDKKETMKRWARNFKNAPDSIRRRLVLENCEKCFNIEDCLEVSKEANIPVVFDTHHHDCYIQLHPDIKLKNAEEYMSDILETWKRRGIKPKFHVSEQGCGRVGHHSDYIETIPNYLLEIPDKYNTDIDIMIEAKLKEKAIFKLYKKYPFLNCKKRFIIYKKKQTKE